MLRKTQTACCIFIKNPMTTEVRFYHLERSGLDQALPGLITKALETGRRVLVKMADERAVERMNEHLWVYNPNSFIPHGAKKDGNAERQHVYLTANDDNPNNADVLILTGGAQAADIKNFKLCCEMLDGRDEAAVSDARARWKTYKDAGYAVAYWQQGEKGWEKKA